MNRPLLTMTGLAAPQASAVLQLATFTIAIPTIRESFSLSADTASWLMLVFTIPYILFMPFYGRLADQFGVRKLMGAGLVVCSVGTAVCLFGSSLASIFVGRAAQGVGLAGVTPLSLSAITKLYRPESRGRALGTWNSTGPLVGMVGPLLGGLLIVAFGWRSLYVPVLVLILLSILAFLRFIHPDTGHELSNERKFDLPGMFLTAVALTAFVLYLSSRPVTGKSAFTDMRLLLVLCISVTLWIVWERRHSLPFVAVGLFRNRQFVAAAGSVSVRMFYMSTLGFLTPLFVSEVLEAGPAMAGLVASLHALALLFTMRLGGAIADRVSRKLPIILGMYGQGVALIWLAASPGTTLPSLVPQIMLHGALAGLSLAPLHHTAMMSVRKEELGAGAGTYSMSRFFGSLVAASLMGVALEYRLGTTVPIRDAYRFCFLIAAVVGILGSSLTLLIRDRRSAGVRRLANT